MNDTKISTFTVSQLPEIQNISHDDLLMITDYDDSRRYTKKMSLSSFYNAIADDSIISGAILDSSRAMCRAIDQKISTQIAEKVAEEVSKQVISDLSAKVLAIISANYQLVDDMMDGKVDGERSIQSLDE